MFQQRIKSSLSKQESHDSSPLYWKCTTIAEVSSLSGGGTPSTARAEYWDGDIPWLTPSEVTRCKNIFISCTERNITGAGLAASASKLLPVGTVMMTSRATIGEAVINAVPMATNQGFINILCNENQLDNVFLVYWIKHHKQALEARGYGATFKELSKSNFKSMTILLPPLPEQRAIAHILQTVQNAIQARRNELALERERKAALMQHLFTRGTRGEATKQTEIGEMPESWEVSELGDKCNVTTGTTPATDNPLYYKGNTSFVKTAEIANNRIKNSDIYISDEAVRVYNLKIYPPGTIFLAMYGQGKTRGQVALLEIHAATTQNTGAICVGEELEPEFLWQWLMSQYSNLREAGSLGHISHLNLGYVKHYKIPVPSLNEQMIIIDTLNACDSKIAALEKELALQEELFRALLEELMSGRLSALPLVEAEGGAREA